ncbi:ATP-dependent helicase HrpB [Pseudomaricurvus alkylphenolicus]|uniref:ATP-dependent helicase HrpB n=1 Tax=Pseudomaricurvus alkylphenolicus TaxID=1306991 RepID=UPI0030B8B526
MMPELPIHQVIADIQVALSERDELVLEAPPGAGKTTVVPLQLLHQPWLEGQKILMLEPRRLAARAAAERMADTLGEPVGQTVGYRVRLDSKVSKATRIEVVTEGILTGMLQDDPSLEEVGVLIFDEFHERSLDADLGLALALQGRELFGDLREQALKIVVMSATLDGEEVSELLGSEALGPAPLIRSEGRMFEVALRYGAPYQFGETIADRVVETVVQALADESGSLLVFLPGQAEIRRVHQGLNQKLGSDDRLLIAPLFGDLSLSEQRRAIEPAPAGKRKIVLATNIAETSLTINGVRVVVDSGLCRQPAFDPNTAMTRLSTQRISKAASIQRMGRAGRTEPGVCYRLWSERQQDELAAFTSPEMRQADLAPLALQLLNWGVDDVADLSWLDAPASAPYEQALELLQQLKAARRHGGQWQITEDGKAMSILPTHPRLAHMLVRARRSGLDDLACELAALLSEKDLLPGVGGDLHLRLEALRGERACPANQKGRRQRLLQMKKQFQQTLSKLSLKTDALERFQGADEEALGLLLACAYPDRIAKQRDAQSLNYQMANGRSVEFANRDALCQFQWLVIVDVGGQKGYSTDRIFLAAHLDPELFEDDLAELVEERVLLEWDARQEKLLAEKRLLIGRVTLSSVPLVSLSSEQKQQALMELVRKRGLTLLNWPEEVLQWRARVQLLRQLDDNSSQWPDVSDEGLLATMEDWLAPYLDKVTKLDHFKSLDVGSMLAGLLPWPLPQTLDEQAPLRLKVPSGSTAALDYQQSPPVLAVKLQEMFGCTDTPTIANGRVKVMLHLLSPARRPLQVTQDLAGFWAGSYELVKKEMKGRYPKHPWPDDPLQAVATAKTKARM